MTAYRIWLSRTQQLEDEIWAGSQRRQETIVDLLQAGSPDTVITYGAVPGGAETGTGTWWGACGGFMRRGADCECPDKTAERGPLEAPQYSAECPECGEVAVRLALAALVPWEAHGLECPQGSHADPTALCPVIGPGGWYQPAQPRWAEPHPAPGADAAGLDPSAAMRVRWSAHEAHEPEAG